MVPTIGLIVAVYGVVRLIQAPLMLTGGAHEKPPLPLGIRFFIVAASSAGGVVVLAILGLLLLGQ